MGEPLECEHTDPVSRQVAQRTSTGVAVFSPASGTSSFVAGERHWAVIDGKLAFWLGSSTDPPMGLVPYAAGYPKSLKSIGSEPATKLPINGRFLMVSMHGALFHKVPSDFAENVAYARWLGAGAIRVFGTDSNTYQQWDGNRVGNVIADNAQVLRQSGIKLVVAFVNNHQPVPGEAPDAWGWKDGYIQLLQPFYERSWRGAYLTFVRDLVTTVKSRGALDVIQAWELGNELHTPDNPVTIVQFISDAVSEVRRLDPATPVYPGTMGANHLEPWDTRSAIARWIYCEAPVQAYTLHAYDWVSRTRQGDMPIEWDLDGITADPCPSGRKLPVIVEELGTSRALDGIYSSADETARFRREADQLRFVLSFPQVEGVGVWNAESPRVQDRTFYDNRRGLTSYGVHVDGGGSCYDPQPDSGPGVRCQLERVLQNLPRLPQ